MTTENQTKKGLKSFTTMYIIALVFACTKLFEYILWTFKLSKSWNLPEDAFFSKVNLMNANVEISVMAYLIFSIAYIIAFGFIIKGLSQLHSTTKLFEQRKIFQTEVSSAFKKAGNSFLIYAFATLFIDIALLMWARTSSRFLDLLSTELLVFLIFGYFMFFLSDVFKEGISLREENELTI